MIISRNSIYIKFSVLSERHVHRKVYVILLFVVKAMFILLNNMKYVFKEAARVKCNFSHYLYSLSLFIFFYFRKKK